MTQDEIIRMAREAGFARYMTDGEINWQMFERFAALVAKAERNRIADHFDGMPSREMFGGTVADEIREHEMNNQQRAAMQQPTGIGKEDLQSVRKVIGDMRFMQAASIVASGLNDSKQASAYMKELARLNKLLEQEIFR